MCRTRAACGTAEERVRRIGVRIREVAGLTGALVFNSRGELPAIYLPPEWSGPMRDQAIVKCMEQLAARVWDEAAITAVWEGIVADAQGVPAPPRRAHWGRPGGLYDDQLASK